MVTLSKMFQTKNLKRKKNLKTESKMLVFQIEDDKEQILEKKSKKKI